MKILKWSLTALLGLIVVCLAFVLISPDYNMHIVMSDSMKPAINTGDMIFTGPPGGSGGDNLQPGAIVTYLHGKELITHRIVSIDDGTLVTKGDANEETDPWSVSTSSINGAYLFKIPYLGYINSFIRTKLGWFLVIILPAMLLVSYIIWQIIKEALGRGVNKYTHT